MIVDQPLASLVKGTFRVQGLGFRDVVKGISLGTPNREPQEYSRKIIGIYLPGSLYSYYILGVPCVGFPTKSLNWYVFRVQGLGFRI